MLQAVGSGHDNHFTRSESSSLGSLVQAMKDGKKHLLLAASGSVATIKIPVIVEALAAFAGVLSIRIVLTKCAGEFLNGQSSEQPTVSSLLHLPNVEAVYLDEDEWGPQPWRRGASILHIELRRWADMLVIAPLSANTLAKIVNGMSDNLLTSVVRAWDTDGSIDLKKKYIAVAPAMNSAMWRHPITAKHIRTLREDWGIKETLLDANGAARLIDGWFQIIPPISKTLACGDTGDGAMAKVETICDIVIHRLNLTRSEAH
ncbi:putative Phosphopantothenoylcysteine decarboxylase [Triangularia verruculosa]|uniref:Phosphopantothenoylcysteine decarboxylase n=1 Tax=Triangularia verruculosa TaxID=2587418 RepID=A0AAN7AVU0_9PEZI|nr:putative Phosphopantothenoylcysteine decarboxylase [Triangularia verruculosa]